MIRFQLLALIILLLPLCKIAMHAVGAEQESAPLLSREIEIEGKVHRYAVYIPNDLQPDAKMPCIVFLHGKGECGEDGMRQTQIGLAPAILQSPESWPFIVIMPQKPVQDRPWEDFSMLVLGALEAAKKEWTIDEDRVYLTGLSQGGHGTWAIASRYRDVWAAIAPVCGYPEPMSAKEIAYGVRSLPIWAFHGLADDLVVPERTTRITDLIQAERGQDASAPDLIVSLYPDVNHNSWDKAYRDEPLAQWFLKHSRR